jgi:uncharacterized protein YggE
MSRHAIDLDGPGGGSAAVTVVGRGAASVVPDTALLQLGGETRGATPAAALEGCRAALDRVLAELDAEHIEPARRSTSGLELQEDWETRQSGRKGPVGYRATARLEVRLADPARAGQVAAAAVAASGDAARVHGLGFVVGDPAAVAAAAREAAWRDALARATQYAALAGSALGRVLRVEEGTPPPEVRPMRLMAAEAAPGGPATEPGETTVWATVTVTWALEPPHRRS